MTDLTPGELAKIDQIHAAVTGKLAELIASAAEGIRTEGEAVTASALAGTAHGTDHNSVSTLLAAALIRLARHQIANEKRRTLGEPVKVEHGYLSEHIDFDGETEGFVFGHDGSAEEFALTSTKETHDNPTYPRQYSRVIRYTETTYRTAETVLLELGTKPEVIGDGNVG